MKCKVCGCSKKDLILDKFNVSCKGCGSFVCGNIFTPNATIQRLAEYVGLDVEQFKKESKKAGNDLDDAKQFTADYVKSMIARGSDRDLYKEYFDDVTKAGITLDTTMEELQSFTEDEVTTALSAFDTAELQGDVDICDCCYQQTDPDELRHHSVLFQCGTSFRCQFVCTSCKVLCDRIANNNGFHVFTTQEQANIYQQRTKCML